MSPRAQARLLNRLERQHGKAVRDAFAAAIRDLRNGVDFAALQRAIAAGDVGRAVAAIGVDPARFRDFERSLEFTFEEGGREFTNSLPSDVRNPRGDLVRFAFDMRNPAAERWLRQEAGGLITRIVADQREAIRDHLSDSLARGINPRTSALEIAGRINRTTGRREGGILGLSSPQARYARSARSELLSGDPEGLRNYLGRSVRDKRFDATVKAAIREGRGVPRNVADRAANRYADRLLKVRADTVSRTETLNALRAGHHQAFTQGAEQAGLGEQDVVRIWDSSGDSRTRSTHAAADGQRVEGREAPFVVGGYRMRYPGDGSMGAPASETVQCRCIQTIRVDFIGQQARAEQQGAPQAPAETPAARLERANAEAKDHVLTNGRAEGVEHLVLIDEATGEVVDRARGVVNAVNPTQAGLAAIRDPSRRVIAHHNHPSSTSLSAADVRVGQAAGGGVWAHAHNGTSYFARQKGQALTERMIKARAKVVRERLWGALREGRLTSADAAFFNNHLIWSSFARRRRLEYRADFDPATLRRVEALSDLFEEIIS